MRSVMRAEPGSSPKPPVAGSPLGGMDPAAPLLARRGEPEDRAPNALPAGRGEPAVGAQPCSAARELAVDARDVVRAFGPKPVLRGVDLALERGERLALFGANGAGKTTFLRVLATLARPDSGSARVGGYDVVHDADMVRRIVGYVGHQPHIYEELTVRENLRFFARMYGVRDAAGRAEALIARMGLSARADDRARTLSRGLLQRLALARGIIQEPEVLLLDEPETGLDEHAFDLLRGLIDERAAAGRTTIFTMHDIERGRQLASAVAVIARGRVAHAGAAADLDMPAVRALLAGRAEMGRAR